MTIFRYTHTRLLVTDLPACVRFYRDLLGLPTTFGDEDSVYVEFDTGSVRLSLCGRQMMADIAGDGDLPLHVAAQTRVLLFLAVENVDSAYDDLKARGVEFVVPPTDRPHWGLRTAHFRDPDLADRYLLEGLWLSRTTPPTAENIHTLLEWCAEIISQDEPLPPPGLVSDLGMLALTVSIRESSF